MEPRPPDRPLIGRVDLYQALLRRRDEVHNGRGGITFLEGDVGVGKSTLLGALTEDSAHHEFRVVTARSEPQAPVPFQLVRTVVRAVDREAAALSATSPSPLAYPYMAQPMISTSLASAVGRTSAHARRTEASLFPSVAFGDSFQTDRVQLMEELAAPLFALVDQVPVLVAIRDLQWTDEGSLDFLEYIAPRLESRRLWWIGTTPPWSSWNRSSGPRSNGCSRWGPLVCGSDP